MTILFFIFIGVVGVGIISIFVRDESEPAEGDQAQKLYTEEDFNKNPALLRGHDLLVTSWKRINQSIYEPEKKMLGVILMNATAVEMTIGRKYDGRPISSGALSEKDYADYFDWIDSVAPLDKRVRAFFGKGVKRKIHKGVVLGELPSDPTGHNELDRLIRCAKEVRG